MPPKKAATTAKDEVVRDAATFDVDAWLNQLSASGFQPRNVKVKLHMRGDLLPRINALIEQIQNDDGEREVGIDDDDPKAALIGEYEELNAQFEAGGFLEFTFRPMTKAMHNSTYKAWQELYPGETHADEEWDDLALMRMVETCIDFPGKGVLGDKLTVEALRAFETAYGTPAFNTLAVGWSDAYSAGGEVAAPFSPKPSPTPGTEK